MVSTYKNTNVINFEQQNNFHMFVILPYFAIVKIRLLKNVCTNKYIVLNILYIVIIVFHNIRNFVFKMFTK